MDAKSLRPSIAEIATGTGVPLELLIKSIEVRDVVQVRLLRLQRSAHPAS